MDPWTEIRRIRTNLLEYSMDNPWIIHGASMDNLWILNGYSLECPWRIHGYSGHFVVESGSGHFLLEGGTMDTPWIMQEKTDIGVSTTWQAMEVKRLLTRRHSMVFQRASSCVSQNYKNHHRKEGSPDMGNVFLFTRISVYNAIYIALRNH